MNAQIVHINMINRDEIDKYKDMKIYASINNQIEKSIKVYYPDPTFQSLVIQENGDWIDMKCAEDISLKRGESAKISLGVVLKAPKGFEIHVVPRSSLFSKYKVIQTNSIGIIDNSYCGPNDIIKLPVYALEDTFIPKGTRICQFRIVPTMESYLTTLLGFNDKITLWEVDSMEDTNRGGFGSTGDC